MKVSEHIRQASIPGLTEKMWFNLWQPGKSWKTHWYTIDEVLWWGIKANVMSGLVVNNKVAVLGFGFLVPNNTPVQLKQSIAKMGYKQLSDDKYMYEKRIVVPIKKLKTVEDIRGLVTRWRSELVKIWPVGLAIYKATYKKPKWTTMLKEYGKALLPWLGLVALSSLPLILGETEE